MAIAHKFAASLCQGPAAAEKFLQAHLLDLPEILNTLLKHHLVNDGTKPRSLMYIKLLPAIAQRNFFTLLLTSSQSKSFCDNWLLRSLVQRFIEENESDTDLWSRELAAQVAMRWDIGRRGDETEGTLSSIYLWKAEKEEEEEEEWPESVSASIPPLPLLTKNKSQELLSNLLVVDPFLQEWREKPDAGFLRDMARQHRAAFNFFCSDERETEDVSPLDFSRPEDSLEEMETETENTAKAAADAEMAEASSTKADTLLEDPNDPKAMEQERELAHIEQDKDTMTIPEEAMARAKSIREDNIRIVPHSPPPLVQKTAKATLELLRESQQWRSSPEEDENINIALEIASQFGLSECVDELTASIVSQALAEHLSSRLLAVLVYTALFEKINRLERPASRVLANSVISIAKSHPQVVVDDLLLPLLWQEPMMVGSVQCELATRILRDGLQRELLPEAIASLLRSPRAIGLFRLRNSGATAFPGFTLTDLSIPLIQQMLNMKIDLSQEAVDALIWKVEKAGQDVAELYASSKYCNLIFALVSKYPTKVISHVETLREVLSHCQGMMAKAATNALQKLSKT